MADSKYTYNLVYYPFQVARVRLPMGLPAGAGFMTPKEKALAKCFAQIPFPASPYFSQALAGLAEKNLPSADYKKDVLKYIPITRQYGLDAAADHLHDWVTGQMTLEPLLDVSVCHGP